LCSSQIGGRLDIEENYRARAAVGRGAAGLAPGYSARLSVPVEVEVLFIELPAHLSLSRVHLG
jgi:hypothetical protein